MRFYYISLLSPILLGAIYVLGTGLLLWFGAWLRKRMKKPWIVMAPLFALLYIGPVAEEFWIAWNFGQLCRKDAGIFVYKTVEVEGFYDATAGLYAVSNPVPKPAADYYEKGGFQFYELSMADPRGGPSRVAHYAKVNGVWTATVLDKPTARYHYQGNVYGKDVAHGVQKFEDVVVDTTTDEVLGRYLIYYRDGPWFFIGLDRPTIPCRETQEASRRYGSLIYRAVLQPLKE